MRVGSEKQPKGAKKVQQTNKKRGTKEIKKDEEKENTVEALVSDHLANSKQWP